MNRKRAAPALRGAWGSVLLAVVAVHGSAARAADLWVCLDPCPPHPGPSYASLQGAVDAATAGDRVIVAPGSYAQAVSVTKDLTLLGLAGSTGTMLRASGGDWSIDLAPGVRATVAGFAFEPLRGAVRVGAGAVVELRDLATRDWTFPGPFLQTDRSSVTLSDVELVAVAVQVDPIALSGGSSALSRVRLVDVDASGPVGTGVRVTDGGDAVLTDSWFVRGGGAAAGALRVSGGATARLERASVVDGSTVGVVVESGSLGLQGDVFERNQRGAVAYGAGTIGAVDVQRSAFLSNGSSGAPAGPALSVAGGPSVVIRDCLFAANRAKNGAAAVQLVGVAGTSLLDRVVISGNTATGNTIAAVTLDAWGDGPFDIQRSAFADNVAHGSILSAQGGDVLTMTASVFCGNAANSEAPIDLAIASARVSSTVIDRNTAGPLNTPLFKVSSTTSTFENDLFVAATDHPQLVLDGGTSSFIGNIGVAPPGAPPPPFGRAVGDVLLDSRFNLWHPYTTPDAVWVLPLVEGATPRFADPDIEGTTSVAPCAERRYRPAAGSPAFTAGAGDPKPAWAGPYASAIDPQGPLEDSDGDGYMGVYDCDDADAAVNPGAPEICNGLDDDCDRRVDSQQVDDQGRVTSTGATDAYPDDDHDGFGRPLGAAETTLPWCAGDALPPGRAFTTTDCDDRNSLSRPGLDEVAYNGIDDDCSGGDRCDLDGDGEDSAGCPAGGADCDDGNPAVNTLQPEVCNGVDDDCDGQRDEDALDATIWHPDVDGDGWGGPTVLLACVRPVGATETPGDCEDADVDVNPLGTEVPYDGHDNDCDPATPDDDLDGDAFTHAADCDDDDPERNPDADEIPYNDVDDDCDPTTPDDDLDGDGFPRDADCDDQDATRNPDADEVPYDRVDQDCDGDDVCDVDADGHDAIACGGDDCADDDDASFPGASEIADDGIDQNCEGNDLLVRLGGANGLACGCATGPGSALAPLFGLLALAFALRPRVSRSRSRPRRARRPQIG